MKNNQQGRSMIEMLGVLAIVGLLSMAGISLYTKALYQRKVSTTIDQISEIMINVRNIYKGRRNYEFPNWNKGPEADTKKIIPDSMWLKNGSAWQIKTALKQDVSLYDSCNESSGCSGKTFYMDVAFLAMTKDDVNSCVKIATSDWGGNIKICVEEGGCNCTNVASCNSVLSMNDAIKGCNAVGNDRKITFYVK